MSYRAIGSSPRVRGTALYPMVKYWFPRFIPACAGNRVHLRGWHQDIPVHPRVCGEQLLMVKNIHRPAGSSPRVRGTDSPGTPGPSRSRFIPACAGNSADPARCSWKRSVHPRVCGEQRRHHLLDGLSHGSSPRVRGTDPSIGSSPYAVRFIPACAGNRACRSQYAAHSPVHPRVCGEQCPEAHNSSINLGSSPRVRGTVSRNGCPGHQ